jgi:hypothetical protein
MKTFDIKFRNFFDRSISTRSAIESLFSFDKTGIDEVNLDFADIILISASAAHQIVLEIKRLEVSHIQVNKINLDNHINRMLELSKTDRKNLLTVQTFERFKVKTASDFNSFLLSFE